MKRPDPSLIRVSLKTFLGEDQYREFLEAGAREPLKHWQERAWDEFIERYPQLAVTATERADALDVCPAHECALLAGFTESLTGVDINPTQRQIFPRAPPIPLSPSGGIQRVRYCPTCVAEKAEYDKHQPKR